jgi:NADH-quinone oxidoreductase subunit N
MIHTIIYAVRGFLSGDGSLILPELELLLFACGILLIDRWLAANEKHWNALLALGGIAFSAFTLYVQHEKLNALAGMNPESPGLLAFRQSVLVDPFFLFFAALFLAATALTILLSVRYLEIEEEGRGAYYALLLFACVGMMLMVSGIDLIVVFAGLVVMVLTCFQIIRFLRSEARARAASLKYALLSLLSLALLASGMLILHHMFQTTNLGRMSTVFDFRSDLGTANGGLTGGLAALSLALLGIGVLVQTEVLTFPKWVADVQEAAPLPVSALLATAGMTAGFVLLVRMLVFVFSYAHDRWKFAIAGLALAALAWGNFAALRQNSVPRLLAYGSVAHAGFILLGVVAGNETGFYGIAFYLGVNIFMTVGAYGVLIVLQKRGTAGPALADFNGLNRRSPVAALLLLVFMMSLAGIPPTAGFVAKYYIVKGLIQAAHPVQAAFAVGIALSSVYCYGRVVAHAFRKPATETWQLDAARLTISNGQTVALTIAVFVSLAAGLYPEPFLRMARYAFGQ